MAGPETTQRQTLLAAAELVTCARQYAASATALGPRLNRISQLVGDLAMRLDEAVRVIDNKLIEHKGLMHASNVRLLRVEGLLARKKKKTHKKQPRRRPRR